MNRFHAGVYSFFLALFGLLCYLAHQLPHFPGDIAVSLWLQGIDLPLFKSAMEAISYLGSFIPAIITVALVTGVLWASGRKLESTFIASLASLAAILTWLLKLLISRPRPESGLIETLGGNNGFSFPSGHIVHAMVFYGFLLYLLPRFIRNPPVTVVLQSVLILPILLTGISRVYLGAHWISDTIGSLLLGGLLLTPAIFFYTKYAKETINKSEVTSA